MMLLSYGFVLYMHGVSGWAWQIKKHLYYDNDTTDKLIQSETTAYIAIWLFCWLKRMESQADVCNIEADQSVPRQDLEGVH